MRTLSDQLLEVNRALRARVSELTEKLELSAKREETLHGIINSLLVQRHREDMERTGGAD